MPRAISSTAIAPSACASRIKDGRAKNSARPRHGCSIRSIRAGFELVGARLIAAHPITEVVGAALGFSRSRGRYNAGRTAQNQRANVGSQPHRRRAEFFALPPGGIRAASLAKLGNILPCAHTVPQIPLVNLAILGQKLSPMHGSVSG